MKRFNITGTCFPHKHYMVDTSKKLSAIMRYVEYGEYFIINRPRQYGKTTTLVLLEHKFEQKEEYLPISISFEGIGDAPFESKEAFCPFFLRYLADDILVKRRGLSHIFEEQNKTIDNFEKLSKALSEIIEKLNKKVVLMIDEVDKSSNNQLFLHFLGMLREKYLKAQNNKDSTFHSVILAGVHDVKTLKLKLRPDEEKKYNSPWNIAADFEIDMNFDAEEITSMLIDYSNVTGHKMDIPAVSEKIHFWTSGYPFLVSKLCKIIDETFLPKRECKDWSVDDVDMAVRVLLPESNTLFDDMIKNFENNNELSKFIERLVLGSRDYIFEISVPLINLASIYGIISRKEDGKTKIHNKIFEEKITAYMSGKLELENDQWYISSTQEPYVKVDGRLDFAKLVLKFQEAIKEKYSKTNLFKSDEFLENDLRMLFLIFLKPIINGIGFSFKEVQTSEEKRLDVVVVFRDEKFVVELKVWRGEQYHLKGIRQLKEYMQRESVDKGYMLIMDNTRHKAFVSEEQDGMLMVWI